MAALAKENDLPLVEDVGSGAIVSTDQLAPIDHEPTPNEVLKRGVDLVCFSGDKILGGPQSGIIAGRADLVAGLKKEPFFRALRCDKLILSLLEETASSYLHARAGNRTAQLPLINMLALSTDALLERAKTICEQFKNLDIDCQPGEGKAQVGGGTMPKAMIPSITLDLKPRSMSLEKLAKRLRLLEQPVIGYVSEEVFKVDLRTVFPRQDESLAQAIRSVI